MSWEQENTPVTKSGFKNEAWRLRDTVPLPLEIILEGVDSGAPPLSSLYKTLHAQCQLYQMFSHKAQMGRADKHQLSAECEK